MEDLKLIQEALGRVMAGETLDEQTLYALADIDSAEGKAALRKAAEQITRKFCTTRFDSCSIVNARSGRCSENCKWCAQSAHHNTKCDEYPMIDEQEARRVAQYNAAQGIGRFSFVASGRAVRGKALSQMCAILKGIKDDFGIYTCASMGLLNAEELQQLWDAGVRRYHCNLETAPSHFHKLCTTHTIEDKLNTIAAARKIGFDICSGGIIGMGETRRQRMEFAITLRQAKPDSIPLNVLSPIPGTPLENTPLISEDDVIDTVALFRFAHPSVEIRFAGGRSRLSHDTMVECLKIGINGGIVGDLLTTIGSTVAEDKALTTEAGYEF